MVVVIRSASPQNVKDCGVLFGISGNVSGRVVHGSDGGGDHFGTGEGDSFGEEERRDTVVDMAIPGEAGSGPRAASQVFFQLLLQ